MLLGECEGLLCIIINKISRIISSIANNYSYNKSLRGAGDTVGTVWAQRCELLAAFVSAAVAVGTGGWCDFALSLSGERRNSIFLTSPLLQVF